MILLVRHAAPELSDGVPPSQWPLSAQGLAAAQGLAPRLAALAGRDAVLCASTERKARQTIEPLAVALGRDASGIVLDVRFGEVRRPLEPIGDAWREERRRYVEGALRPDWEPQREVGARFDTAVAEYRVAASGDAALVIATHGMVLTQWLVTTGFVAAEDAGAFWADLRLPDVLAVDVVRGTVTRAEWAGTSRFGTGNGPPAPTR